MGVKSPVGQPQTLPWHPHRGNFPRRYLWPATTPERGRQGVPYSATLPRCHGQFRGPCRGRPWQCGNHPGNTPLPRSRRVGENAGEIELGLLGARQTVGSSPSGAKDLRHKLPCADTLPYAVASRPVADVVTLL